jgi:hypothetical protein
LDADSVIDNFNVSKPDHMKIDVDEIEHQILERCSKSLIGVGLVLKSKHLGCANIYNQIWVRDE